MVIKMDEDELEKYMKESEKCPQCKKEANWKRKLEWEGDIRFRQFLVCQQCGYEKRVRFYEDVKIEKALCALKLFALDSIHLEYNNRKKNEITNSMNAFIGIWESAVDDDYNTMGTKYTEIFGGLYQYEKALIICELIEIIERYIKELKGDKNG